METKRFCQQCQQPLPADAPEGLCPQCLARVALGTEAAAPGATINLNPPTEALPRGRVAPEVAQLAAQFPQLEIIELLGMGGMGMVYKARQPRLDRLVALKILPMESAPHPSFAERFGREAKALAKLNHPGIVSVFDFGQTGQYYYFVMEYVDGVNLRQLLQAGKVEPRQALELVVQVCAALQYAHDEGVVHRDIKPENILLNKKGQAKIADFGLAKLMGAAPDTALTMSQAAMGTLNYMAPEQRQDAQRVDHRADIYSLGVVFYEMLTGEVPMGRFEAPSKRVQVDVRLDEVVLRALEREPARRYQQASEVKTGVEAITAAGLVAPAARATTDPSDGKPPRWFWLRAYGLCTAGWLVTKLLWNFGNLGCWLACLGMAALVTWVSLQRMRYFPDKLAIYQQTARWKRWFMYAQVFPFLTISFICFIAVLLSCWEQDPMHGNMLMRNKEQFEAQYKGKEYLAIRNLAAFAQDIPAVEMADVGPWSGGQWVVGWGKRKPGMNDLLLIPNLLEGTLMLYWMPFCLIGAWRLRGMKFFPFSWHHARAALAITAVVLGSILPIYFFSFFTYGSITTSSSVYYCKTNPEVVTKVIQKWANDNGYALGDDSNWLFNTVPKGKCVAEARLRQAWKSSPFDRWRATWHSFRNLSPRLSFELFSAVDVATSDTTQPHWTTGFQTVTSAGPPQTVVNVYVSSGFAAPVPPDLDAALRKL